MDMGIPDLPFDRTQRRIILVILAALVLILAAFAYAFHQASVAKAYQTQAVQAQQREKLAVDAAKVSDQKALVAQQASQSAALVTQHRLAVFQAAPLPPPPKPAPAEDADLAKGLVTAGLAPGLTLFRPGGPSSLSRPDAVLVWNWSQDSARVPPLMARLGAAESLVDGQAQENQALKTENVLAFQARDDWKNAHGAADDRAEALQKEVKALHRAGTAVKLGTAAVVAGYVIRFLVRRK